LPCGALGGAGRYGKSDRRHRRLLVDRPISECEWAAMGEPPCSELSIRRAQVAEIAQAILDGRLPIVDGARQLAVLWPDVDPGEEDSDLRGLVGIDAEAEHLPDLNGRHLWSPTAFATTDAELAEYAPDFRQDALRMCRALVARYGGHVS
jgi:hypothetical protein